MTATNDHGDAGAGPRASSGPPAVTTVRAAALVTTGDGRVLLAETGNGTGTGTQQWALPAAEPAAGESLHEAAHRAVIAATGLSPRLGELLTVDWSTRSSAEAARTSSHVLDAGGISPSATRRVEARDDGQAAAFVPVDDLSAHVTAGEARRIAAALAARREGRSVACLEDGHAPPAQAVMRRYGITPWVHSGSAWTWHDGEVPEDLPIRQAWVWVFAPDGRVVVYLDENSGIGLPGGTLEDFEHRAPTAAAVREVHEETQIRISDPLYLGYLLDHRPGDPPVARVRFAAAIDAIGPSATDPATGTVHRRLLVPPQLIAELCGWGQGARAQTRAALEAARKLGITPAGAADEVTEIPADGTGVLPAGTGR